MNTKQETKKMRPTINLSPEQENELKALSDSMQIKSGELLQLAIESFLENASDLVATQDKTGIDIKSIAKTAISNHCKSILNNNSVTQTGKRDSDLEQTYQVLKAADMLTFSRLARKTGTNFNTAKNWLKRTHSDDFEVLNNR